MGKFDYIKWVTENKYGKPLTEQTATECSDIAAQAYGGPTYFSSCCEMGYFSNPGSIIDADCKSYIDYGVVTYGLTPAQVGNCCDPNWGVSDDPCQDPLWVNMPAGTASSGGKVNYCERCRESGGGNAQAGNFPVNLNPGVPYWIYDPNNGINYCPCCEGSGDIDCTDLEDVAQNPTAALKCFVCREAPNPCVQLSNIPMTAVQAQALGLTLYNDQASCNASSTCGGGEDPTGSRCDQMTQGVYDPSGNNPNHNENWGMGCWFCHPEPNHPDFPGCTMIQTGMDQVNAYSAFVAGTSNVYTTDAACQADPITKCGEDMIRCECCRDGNGISMQQMVPASQGCAGAENTVYAGLGVTDCAVSPVSGGPGARCKKPPVGTGDIPIDMEEPMPMVRPAEIPTDRVRTLRENKNMKRENKNMNLEKLKNIIKETIKEIDKRPLGSRPTPMNPSTPKAAINMDDKKPCNHYYCDLNVGCPKGCVCKDLVCQDKSTVANSPSGMRGKMEENEGGCGCNK